MSKKSDNNLIPVENEKWSKIKRKLSNILEKITSLKLFKNEKSTTLDKNDPYTIQEQNSNSEEHKNFYIKDGETQSLKGHPAFTSVMLVYENLEKNVYIYSGIVSGAGNATGKLQTDIPIEKIIASPKGNELLQNILKKDYAKKQCEDYWKSIGIEFDESGMGNFFNDSFNLGCIFSKENDFELSSELTPEIEKILKEERENEEAINSRIGKNNCLYRFGKSFNVANNFIEAVPSSINESRYFKGVNVSAISYKYSNVKLISKSEKSFVYSGTLTTGDGMKVENEEENKFLLNSTNIVHENVIIDLPKSIDTIITEHYCKIDDVFAKAFEDKYVTDKLVKDEGLDYSFVGKVEQLGEDSDYILDENAKLKPEIIYNLKLRAKANKTNNSKVIDISNIKQNQINELPYDDMEH